MDYRLRVSPWARTLSLRVTLQGGLEVIAPRRYSPRTIARVLVREQAWIQAALAAADARRQALPPPAPWRVPAEIALPAVGSRWLLALRPTAARGIRVAPIGAGELELAGQVACPAACRRALHRWLVRESQAHLPPWLAGLSRSCELPYAGATIRLVRSRWGSCSRTGIIALNARLLLLSPPLVDYVLVHELCHTRVLNHSPAFWSLVAHHCPDYRVRRAELRTAGKQLPAWAQDHPGVSGES